MPNVKPGDTCQIRGCAKHPQSNGHWVTADSRAFPGEILRANGHTFIAGPAKAWFCVSQGGIPFYDDSVVKEAIFCDKCLHPLRPEGDGVEDNQYRGLDKPVSKLTDLATKNLPAHRPKEKLPA